MTPILIFFFRAFSDAGAISVDAPVIEFRGELTTSIDYQGKLSDPLRFDGEIGETLDFEGTMQ